MPTFAEEFVANKDTLVERMRELLRMKLRMREQEFLIYDCISIVFMEEILRDLSVGLESVDDVDKLDADYIARTLRGAMCFPLTKKEEK